MLLLLSGVAESLSHGLQKSCGLEIVSSHHKLFPDGEQYIRILSEVRDRDVVVAQSMYPNQDSKAVELYLAIEALQGLQATVSTVLIPYMAYARQDKRFLKGEPISVKAIYAPLRLFNVKRLVVVDTHSHDVSALVGIEVVNILPHAYAIKKAGISVDFILSPDRGALHRAESAAKAFGVSFDYLDKFRDRVTGEIKVSPKDLDVRNANVAIVDDIISTGGTIAKACQILYDLGANKVYAVVSHALLSEKSIEVLSKAGLTKLITTNSVKRQINLPEWVLEVDLSELICNELRRAP
ncbi:MAG: ribose-phosphate diphosphokinase [Ignisphaera sp.]